MLNESFFNPLRFDSTAADRQEKILKENLQENQKATHELNNIHTVISGFRSDLRQEIMERKVADKETMEYSKKVDKKSSIFSVVSIGIAFGSFLLALFALIR